MTPNTEPFFEGKTIVSAVYDDGGDLVFTFTDGTTATVHYSCMGGVFVS